MQCAVCLRNHAPTSGLSSCELAELDAAARGESDQADDLIPPNSKFLEMLMRDKDERARAGFVDALKLEFLAVYEGGSTEIVSPPWTAPRLCQLYTDWVTMPDGSRVPAPRTDSVSMSPGDGYQTNDLRAAKERLGAWLVADDGPGRSWIPGKQTFNFPPYIVVSLVTLKIAPTGNDVVETVAEGRGDTLAAAILAALEKVNA